MYLNFETPVVIVDECDGLWMEIVVTVQVVGMRYICDDGTQQKSQCGFLKMVPFHCYGTALSITLITYHRLLVCSCSKFLIKFFSQTFSYCLSR